MLRFLEKGVELNEEVDKGVEHRLGGRKKEKKEMEVRKVWNKRSMLYYQRSFLCRQLLMTFIFWPNFKYLL